MSGFGSAALGVTGLWVAGCSGGATADGLPPPEGLPYLGSRFDVRSRVTGVDCPASPGPWVVGFSEARVHQSAAEVTLTLGNRQDDAVRDVLLHGCVVGTEAEGFRVRLTGVSRSAVADGQTSCEARLVFPAERAPEIDRAEASADADGVSDQGSREDAWVAAGCPEATDAAEAFPHISLAVCKDGGLTGSFEVDLSWTGGPCHEGAPCTLAIEWTASVVEGHPAAPANALLGAACGE